MKRLYCADGTPLDILKKEAKRRKSSDIIKLAEAQNLIAIDHGADNWPRLVASCVDVPNDFDDHLMIEKRIGEDTIVFDVADFYEAEEEFDRQASGEDSDAAISQCYISKYYNYDGNGRLRISIAFQAEKETGSFSRDHELFQFKEPVNLDQLGVSFVSALVLNRASSLVSVLSRSGCFDVDPYATPRSGGHEALLTLALRDKGLKVGDREIFNTPDLEPTGILDTSRRCFVNRLSDGSYVVSNGAEQTDMLLYTVIGADDFRSHIFVMKTELGDDFNTRWESEAWLRNRVLPQADPIVDDIEVHPLDVARGTPLSKTLLHLD